MRHPLSCLSWLGVVALMLVVPGTAPGQAAVSLRLTVEAGAHNRINTPVRAEVPVPADWVGKAKVVLTGPDGKEVPAQLVAASLHQAAEPAKSQPSIYWILPKLSARQSAVYQAIVTATAARADGFSWNDTPGKQVDLLFDKRPMLRYMYQAYENDPAKRDLNNKPFHHLFDPATGQRLVTKGSGGHETHHQGLFFGFTSCSFENGKCNTWYCHDGEHQLHKKFLEQSAGPVLARQRVEIDWNDRQGKAFCTETRELTVYAVPGGTLVEFATRLRSVRGTVTLEGDAHHAGFQFRADNEVSAQRRKEVYFLRTAGKGDLGVEKNDKAMSNLPWNAMSFPLGDSRYTALYLDNPRNPKPSFYSERTYGRFGSGLGKQVIRADGPPLALNYRIWLQQGELSVEQAHAFSADFTEPPQAKVAKNE